MLFVEREKLTQHLLKIGDIISAYQRHDPAFVDRVVDWLNAVEQDLQQFRNPLASFLASERGKIVAVKDGYRDQQISGEKLSNRKAMSASASLALSRSEEALRTEIHDIDSKFDVCREKMSQLLAVSSSKNPIPFPPGDPRIDWLRQVWANLGKVEEAKAMYNYINAIMQSSDKYHLLDELIGNMTSELLH